SFPWCPSSTSGTSKGIAPSCSAISPTRSFGTKKNSASGSTNFLMSQGHATRSTLTCSRVIHFIAHLRRLLSSTLQAKGPPRLRHHGVALPLESVPRVGIGAQPVPRPDEEDVVPGLHRPSKTSVPPGDRAFALVLGEHRELEARCRRQDPTELLEPLDEPAFREVCEIVLADELDEIPSG